MKSADTAYRVEITATKDDYEKKLQEAQQRQLLNLDNVIPALRLMLDDAAPVVVVTERALHAQLGFAELRVCLLDDGAAPEAYPACDPDLAVLPEQLAYVMYTSGSTGAPKGVMVQHASVVNHITAYVRQYGVQASDRVLQFASINFDASVEEIFPALAAGAAIVLHDPVLAGTGDEFTQQLAHHRISILGLPTAFWHEWTRQLEGGASVPDCVRLVVVGGEKAIAERHRAWSRCTAGRSIRWVNTYGPTETTVSVTAYEADGALDDDAELPIGRPIANTQVYILNARRQPVPIGACGELYIAGAGLARGYLNQAQLSAERFVANPYGGAGQGKMYRTGDIGRYRADGQIEYAGRVDAQVKLRGFRIEPGEVESALCRHAEVASAIVLMRDDVPGGRALVAYVTPEAGADPARHPLTAALLGEHLKGQLPAFMLPSWYVVLERLPLTPNGKIDRQALPRPLCDGPGVDGTAPRSATETALAAIWCAVLGLERVGVHDNFFSIGGHSLAAMRAVVEMRKLTGAALSLSRFFEIATIAELALELTEAPAPQRDAVPVALTLGQRSGRLNWD